MQATSNTQQAASNVATRLARQCSTPAYTSVYICSAWPCQMPRCLNDCTRERAGRCVTLPLFYRRRIVPLTTSFGGNCSNLHRKRT